MGVALLFSACEAKLDVPKGAAVACTRGGDCPASFACLVERNVCVDEQAPCIAVDKGEASAANEGGACEGEDGAGVCALGLCGGRCGDGILEVGEACDTGVDNDDTAPDRCRTDCTAPRCGDGVVDSGETCDGSDVVNGACDGCVLLCPAGAADCDASSENGCECAPELVLEAQRDGIAKLVATESSLVWVELIGNRDAVFAANLDGSGAHELFEAVTFVESGFAVRDDPGVVVAYTDNSDAQTRIFEDGTARVITDGVETLALVEGAVWTRRTDGNSLLVSWFELDTGVEHVVERNAGFTHTLAASDENVYWTNERDQLLRAPRLGESADVEVLAQDVTAVAELAVDGDDVYVLDDFQDLFKLENGALALVARQPPPLLGYNAFDAVDVRGGVFAEAFTFSVFQHPETDDGMLVVGDASGSRVAAHEAGTLHGVVVRPDRILYATFDRIAAVPR